VSTTPVTATAATTPSIASAMARGGREIRSRIVRAAGSATTVISIVDGASA
jgi:hypothetical protein